MTATSRPFPRTARSILWFLLLSLLLVIYSTAAHQLISFYGLVQSRNQGGVFLWLLMHPSGLHSAAVTIAVLGCFPVLLLMADFKQQPWWQTLAMTLPSWQSLGLAACLALCWLLLTLGMWQYTQWPVLQHHAQPMGLPLILMSDLLIYLFFALVFFG